MEIAAGELGPVLGHQAVKREWLAAEASGFAGRLGELEALVRGDLEPANDPQPAGNVDASPD